MSASLVGSEMCIRDSGSGGGLCEYTEVRCPSSGAGDSHSLEVTSARIGQESGTEAPCGNACAGAHGHIRGVEATGTGGQGA
eukprot:1650561-Alexandrium_andersonii.AAC.1